VVVWNLVNIGFLCFMNTQYSVIENCCCVTTMNEKSENAKRTHVQSSVRYAG
jgi:hypothetical protein